MRILKHGFSTLTPGQAAAVLQISQSCSEADLKKRFIVLAHQLHPDRPGGSAERFTAAREAFEVLQTRIRAMQKSARSTSTQRARPNTQANDDSSDDFNFGALGLVGMVRSGRLEDAFDYWGALRNSAADIDHDTVIGLIELCQAMPHRLGLASAATILAELAVEGRLVGGGSLTSGAALTHESHAARSSKASTPGNSQGAAAGCSTGTASWAEAAAAGGGVGDRHGVRRPDGLYTRGRARAAATAVAKQSTGANSGDTGPAANHGVGSAGGGDFSAGGGGSGSGTGRALAAPKRSGLWEGGDVDGGTRAAFDELLWHASEAEDMDLVLRVVDEMSDLGVKVRTTLFLLRTPAIIHAHVLCSRLLPCVKRNYSHSFLRQDDTCNARGEVKRPGGDCQVGASLQCTPQLGSGALYSGVNTAPEVLQV